MLADKSGVMLVFCWAHVRRRFYELAAAGPAPIAREALRQIAELYRIEDDIRGRSAEQRRAVRQEKSLSITVALEPWLREKLRLISRKTKLAEAIRYTLSRWEGLSRFLDDGRIEIDSNAVERSIRPIAARTAAALNRLSCRHECPSRSIVRCIRIAIRFRTSAVFSRRAERMGLH